MLLYERVVGLFFLGGDLGLKRMSLAKADGGVARVVARSILCVVMSDVEAKV